MPLNIRPVVSAPLGELLRTLAPADNSEAGCCTVLSVFGVIILVGELICITLERWLTRFSIRIILLSSH